MTLRRLLFASLLSIVVGILASSTSEAATFQGSQLGQGPAIVVLAGHHCEARHISSSASRSSLDLGAAASGGATSVATARWERTASLSKSIAADELSAARTGFTFFHGTSVESGETLLGGAPLDAETAAAEHIDGPGGFNLATEAGDAEYFALRRAPDTILQYDVSEEGLASLQDAGSQLRDIPGGPPYVEGQELNVPESAFDLFNQLMGAGYIEVSPYGG